MCIIEVSDAWLGVFGAVIGVLLGALISWWANNSANQKRVVSLKASLKAEVTKCIQQAKDYLGANIPSPSYRLPIIAYENAFSELLRDGVFTEVPVKTLIEFYMEVEALNRGLNQIHEAMVTSQGGQARDREFERNKLKAQNIIDKAESALSALI